MNSFFSPSSGWLHKGLFIVRVIVGLLLMYHGLEVFNPELMDEYIKWDTFKGQFATFTVYTGKSAELIAGVLLSFGLFTRPCAILVIGTFSFITFFVGQGRFWYEDQHPFMSHSLVYYSFSPVRAPGVLMDLSSGRSGERQALLLDQSIVGDRTVAKTEDRKRKSEETTLR